MAEEANTFDLEPFKDDFALLIEAGFIAVKQLDERSARQMFKAASVLSPNSTVPEVGLGYIAINKMKLKEADEIFESILKKEPENYLAMAFLGVSHVLQKSKRAEGVALLEKARAKTDDPTVKNLADTTLNSLVSDMEKKESKAPFFSKK